MTLRVDSMRQVVDVSLTTSATLSSAVDLGGYRVAAIEMPAASTDWTAANLTFQASDDNVTFRNLYDDNGNEVTVTAAGARTIALGSAASLALLPHRYIKVRTGTAALAVSQTTERTLTLVLEPDR